MAAAHMRLVSPLPGLKSLQLANLLLRFGPSGAAFKAPFYTLLFLRTLLMYNGKEDSKLTAYCI